MGATSIKLSRGMSRRKTLSGTLRGNTNNDKVISRLNWRTKKWRGMPATIKLLLAMPRQRRSLSDKTFMGMQDTIPPYLDWQILKGTRIKVFAQSIKQQTFIINCKREKTGSWPPYCHAPVVRWWVQLVVRLLIINIQNSQRRFLIKEMFGLQISFIILWIWSRARRPTSSVSACFTWVGHIQVQWFRKFVRSLPFAN